MFSLTNHTHFLLMDEDKHPCRKKIEAGQHGMLIQFIEQTGTLCSSPSPYYCYILLFLLIFLFFSETLQVKITINQGACFSSRLSNNGNINNGFVLLSSN